MYAVVVESVPAGVPALRVGLCRPAECGEHGGVLVVLLLVVVRCCVFVMCTQACAHRGVTWCELSAGKWSYTSGLSMCGAGRSPRSPLRAPPAPGRLYALTALALPTCALGLRLPRPGGGEGGGNEPRGVCAGPRPSRRTSVSTGCARLFLFHHNSGREIDMETENRAHTHVSRHASRRVQPRLEQ